MDGPDAAFALATQGMGSAVVLNALLWICKTDVPPDGVASRVTEEEIRENLDPKPLKKK